jgi:tetratricopeptide (TPR) repeat protein
MLHKITFLFAYSLLLSLITVPTYSFSAVVTPDSLLSRTQELSREEARREAGRLATEAERIRQIAHNKVATGASRKLLDEAEKAVVERFLKALELWRVAGDYDRLARGAEELSRTYMVLNDYAAAVACLRREVEFWRGLGDVPRQAHTLWLIGLRQSAWQKDEEAIKTFEQVIKISRAANVVQAEAGALAELERIYRSMGRGKEAEKLQPRVLELRELQMASGQAGQRQQAEPIEIPKQWLDLTSVPLTPEYRDIDGVRQAVLVNRSTKGVTMVMFGCVEEQGGKVQVLYTLFGVGISHGGVRPGYFYEPSKQLNGPLNVWTDEKMGCEGKARMAIISVYFADQTEWKADGTEWIER